MSETDAAYYQAHRDDPDEWEDAPPARKTGARRLASMVSVRFSSAELDLLRSAAQHRNVTMSSFVRSAALQAASLPSPTATITGIPEARTWIVSSASRAPADASPRVVGLPRPDTATAAG